MESLTTLKGRVKEFLQLLKNRLFSSVLFSHVKNTVEKLEFQNLEVHRNLNVFVEKKGILGIV